MPAIVKSQRGDISKSNLHEGQLFWSFINTDKDTSEGHTYSEGQLWILSREPGANAQKTVEIGGVRSSKAMVYRGIMPHSNEDSGYVNGKFDFTKSADVKLNHPHVGDFWMFDVNDTTSFDVIFHRGDLILITDTEYETNKSATSGFSDTLKSVSYKKVSASSASVDYKGHVDSAADIDALSKEYGNFYLVTSQTPFDADDFDTGTETLTFGDFILCNIDLKWTKIDSHLIRMAENVYYEPDKESIEAVSTFTSDHKALLKGFTDVQEAIRQLSIHKAELDDTGHIIYDQLPVELQEKILDFIENLTNKYQGIWDPLATYISTHINAQDMSEYNLAENQDPYPAKKKDADGNDMSYYGGDYYIIQLADNDPDIPYVQYVDTQDGTEKTIEYASGDWIVWNDTDGKWDKIDNSDRLNSIVADIDTTGKGKSKETALTGNVHFSVGNSENENNKLLIRVDGNDTIVIYGQRLVNQDPNENGKIKYFPIYSNADNINQIKNSHMYESDGFIYDEINFQVGAESNERIAKVYGDIDIVTTYNTDYAAYHNSKEKHYAIFYNTVGDASNVGYIDEKTRVSATDRTTLQDRLSEDSTIDVTLPEANSTLVGIFTGDKIKKDYFTKASWDGFITYTSLLEEVLNDKTFVTFTEQNAQSKNVYTGDIYFYDFNGYEVNNFDNRCVDLLMDPLTNKQIKVYLPVEGGTLMTLEDFYGFIVADIHRVPKVLEGVDKNGNDAKFLVNSPIYARTPGQVLSVSYHALENGSIVEKAFTYTDTTTLSNQASQAYKDLNSTNATSESISFTSFDSFVQANSSIMTKDTFMLLSKNGGKHYAMVEPSQRHFNDSVSYRDPFTESLQNQDKVKKIEMPAESGVLLTNNSRVYGGFYAKDYANTTTSGEKVRNFNLRYQIIPTKKSSN